MKTIFTAIIVISVLSIGICQVQAGEIIHVGIGGGYIYNTIHDGITAASNGDTVLVHDGIYTGSGNRDLSLQGKEIILKSVNGATNCIIDVAASNDEWHNAFSLTSGETNATVIDGFTITGGYTYQGGGMYIEGSSPSIRNSVFTGNTGGFGGAIALYNSDAIISNSLIYENTGWDIGGGIYYGSYGGTLSDVLIRNSTIAKNTGEGIYGYKGNMNLFDTIVWGNDVSYLDIQIALGKSSMLVDYSDIEGGEAGIYVDAYGVLNWGDNNIFDDPEFTIGPLGNHYLSHIAAGQLVDSPCINVGSDLAISLGLDVYTTRTDTVGDIGIVDMGYHYIPEPCSLLMLVLGVAAISRRREFKI